MQLSIKNTTFVQEDWEKIRTNSISTRLRLLLASKTEVKGRFLELELMTGINATTWRTWWTRGDVPNGNLIEGAAKLWPEYAYWLACGTTDIRCGHDMPELDPIAKGYISNWPEQATVRDELVNNSFSKEYLKACTKASNQNNKDQNNAQEFLKYKTLRVLSIEREKEIEANFAVPLAFETWPPV